MPVPGVPDYCGRCRTYRPGSQGAKAVTKANSISNIIAGSLAIDRQQTIETQIKGVDVRLIEALNSMAKDYGVIIQINWGFRTHSEQDDLFKDPNTVAAPMYSSWHEYGGAVDVYMGGAFGALNLSDKAYASYGLVRTALSQNEPWHFQLIGVSSSALTNKTEGTNYQNSITTWGDKYG